MRRRIQRGLTWAAGLCACGAVVVPAGAPAASSGAPDKGARAADCTTEARLSRKSPSVVRYVVWCGVQTGRVTLRVRPMSGGLRAFSRNAPATGPGASGPLHCRRVHGERLFCAGRKDGPVTFRGSVVVTPGTRCAAKLQLNVWGWTGDSLDFPAGCPKGFQEQERSVREIVEKRTDDGLDLDLKGDRAAIVRRAKALLRAWRRGDPVARWTNEEEVFGMPLRAAEQTELEYRDTYREHFQDLIEGDWVDENASSSYAGYELDEAAGGIIYVGFTVEPEAMLEKLKRSLIAPERFKPFPVTPTHTEAELEDILSEFVESENPLWKWVTEAGIDYLANKVELGTTHLARVRRLVEQIYGPDAPFEVVFARPAILL